MFNYVSAISRCSDPGLKNLLKKLECYQEYSMLCDATAKTFTDFKQLYPNAPYQVIAWYKFANGGFLFDTQFLSTEALNRDLIVGMMKLDMVNDEAIQKITGCPKNYIAFAIASFGDLYCFNNSGGSDVIQWSIAEKKIVGRWTNFFIWLKQEIDGALELVADNILTPLGCYSEEEM